MAPQERLPVHPRDAYGDLASVFRDPASVFAGTQDLIREVVTHLAQEPVHERRRVGLALMLTSKSLFYNGARLTWHDIQDYPDLAPLFLLLDRVSFSDGLYEKLASLDRSSYVYFTICHAPYHAITMTPPHTATLGSISKSFRAAHIGIIFYSTHRLYKKLQLTPSTFLVG